MNLMVEDPKTQARALARLRRATTAFNKSRDQHERDRQELADAIAEAFLANLPPAKIEETAPYDRNHIGRIRQAAGIRPKRDRDREAAHTWFDSLNNTDRTLFIANRKHLTAELAKQIKATGAPIGYGGWGHGTQPTSYWLTAPYRKVLDEAAKKSEQED